METKIKIPDKIALSDRECLLVCAVMAEYRKAIATHKPFNSAHEGWAVIYEELHELFDEVKLKAENRSKECMGKEAV